MPLAFLDYVPVDLDAQRHEKVGTELAKAAEEIEYPKELVSTALRFGAIYSEVLAEAEAWGARSYRRRIASAQYVDLPARLQC